MRLAKTAHYLNLRERRFTTLDIVKEEISDSALDYKNIAGDSTLFIQHPTTEQLSGRKLKEKGKCYRMYSHTL